MQVSFLPFFFRYLTRMHIMTKIRQSRLILMLYCKKWKYNIGKFSLQVYETFYIFIHIYIYIQCYPFYLNKDIKETQDKTWQISLDIPLEYCEGRETFDIFRATNSLVNSNEYTKNFLLEVGMAFPPNKKINFSKSIFWVVRNKLIGVYIDHD